MEEIGICIPFCDLFGRWFHDFYQGQYGINPLTELEFVDHKMYRLLIPADKALYYALEYSPAEWADAKLPVDEYVLDWKLFGDGRGRFWEMAYVLELNRVVVLDTNT